MPDVVAPPPRHPRFPLMEGMRAIAVLAVVLVHCASASGEFSVPVLGPVLARMNIGVTIFFLISGFLLYRPMIAHRGAGAPAPPVGQYLKRRLLRILPAYWAALSILAICSPTLGRVDSGGLWPMYLLVETLGLTHGPTCAQEAFRCGLAHTWSLVAEATFYLVLPAFALGLGALCARLPLRAWVAAQLGVLALLSTASVLLQFAVLRPVPALLSGSVGGYVLWFALGMSYAVLSVWSRAPGQGARLERAGRFSATAWLAAVLLYLALVLWLPANPFLFARRDIAIAHVCYGVIAALLLWPAVFDAGRGWPRRLLVHPIMAWLGTISYGVFLWHYVITLKLGPNGAKAPFVVNLLGTVVLSVACAALSYYVLERPLLRLKYERLSDALAGLRRRPRYADPVS